MFMKNRCVKAFGKITVLFENEFCVDAIATNEKKKR